MESMSTTDREEFNFDLSQINWADYARDCAYGLRTYYLKQDPSTIPESNARMKR
jgi:hypothetical protein